MTEFPLSKDLVSIGRVAVRNDLVLEDPAVSREHALLRRQEDGWIVEDRGSANGTLVNGVPVNGTRRLVAEDLILIGNTTLTFRPGNGAVQGLPFGDSGDLAGSVMVSVVPEELLETLREATTGVLPVLPPLEERFDETGSGRPPGDAEVARLQKKAKILALLYELGRTLGSAFTLPEIYRKAAEMLFSITPADHCVILLKEDGALTPVSIEVSEHLKGPWVPESRRRNVVVSSTITSRVMREGVALLVYDAQKDYAASDSVKMQAIRSVMCAPLKGTGGFVGAIYVDRRDLLSRFEEEDLDLLSAIASQTAIAIENTLAREQLHREAAARERLGRFLPTAVVERVLNGEIKLGGVAQEVTTLFADIRGFTPLAESTPPEAVVDVLNEHFRVMSDAVLRYGGTLDKYIGDSVMALFGAPDNAPDDDPIHAVDCAIAMQKGMRQVNDTLTARGLPTIRIGIGINTGRVVVGEIGSERLMSYTAIGDAVNLAARLEATALPGQILVSSMTARGLKNSFALNPLPSIKVKGRAQPVSIYEVLWTE